MSTRAPIYLDHAATTPVDPRVAAVVMHHMVEEFGNAGSRTHEYGTRSARAVEHARAQVAAVVDVDPAEVIFTSGATESDNLAILGLAQHGLASGRRHIVSTAIEHKAVLEPLEHLAERGFEIELVRPEPSGAVDPEQVLSSVRADTLLVLVMHVNNETGIQQPVEAIGDGLEDPGVYFHSDAAQGFGKVFEPLRHPRLDMVSVSGHKIYAPKGIGALVTRRRDRKRPPLTPLLMGGGQERGLRPGTLPVHLAAGLGLASELAASEATSRRDHAEEMRVRVLEAITAVGAQVNGDPARSVPNIINTSIPDLDSEAVILALRDLVSISNGSACTSATYEPSHVLTAMGLSDSRRRGAIRLSWGPGANPPDFAAVKSQIERLQ